MSFSFLGEGSFGVASHSVELDVLGAPRSKQGVSHSFMLQQFSMSMSSQTDEPRCLCPERTITRLRILGFLSSFRTFMYRKMTAEKRSTTKRDKLEQIIM